MRLGNLVWHRDGEGRVNLCKEFYEESWIVKADALVDWIAELQGIYDELLEGIERGEPNSLRTNAERHKVPE